MTLIAYDPYVQPARAAQMGVRMVSLDELLAQSDFITVHLPKTPETLGLIGDEALHKVKPTVRIINAARGGIVDEAGARRRAQGGPRRRRRHRRLRQGAVHRLARSSSFEQRRRDPAPGRVAPTRRRRRPVSRSRGPYGSRWPASSCPTRSTSRAASSPRTYARACRSPRSSAGSSPRWPARSPPRLDVEVRGEIAQHDVKVLELAALKGVFTDVVEEHGVLRQRPAVRQGARRRGPADHRARRAPTTATW